MRLTLDEAIKTQESIKYVCRTLLPPKEQEALSVGIEALKRVQDARDIDPESPAADLLPGETEDKGVT